MKSDYIIFAEPHPEFGDMTIVMPTSFAIIVQQYINAKRTPPHVMSDEDALDEFMVTNWASFYEKSS